MKILCNDIGAGTQDIYLFDSRLDIENGYKLILPSPTMQMYRRLLKHLNTAVPICLTGVTMGGGPSAWAVEELLHQGTPVYATPDAAMTLDDDLVSVQERGIRLVSDDEVRKLPPDVERFEFLDFDFENIEAVFSHFGVDLQDLDAVAVAVFDHGKAPAAVSERKFRFDFLAERIREDPHLSNFAYLAQHIPERMTRMLAVRASMARLDCPLILMDSAPAAVLGAMLDPLGSRTRHRLMVNIGNFHTIAFRMNKNDIEGVFEHHTGELTSASLEQYLRALANGSLTNEQIYASQGHGASLMNREPIDVWNQQGGLVVSGPRRHLITSSSLRPYFPAPFGDMMIAGCFGLLAATADLLPEMRDAIFTALYRSGDSKVAPWDLRN